MSVRKRPENAIEEAVKFFSTAETRQKFKGNERLLTSLELIEQTSITTGLSPQHILVLVDVAASGIQVETVSKRIIKALIPTSVVPEAAVLKSISWLCTRKPSINIQCLLLRWILVIYDHIDSLDRVHALYGIIFHFLHYRTLMPYTCHLLYLLTRKEDVKLFRVRYLLQYQKDMGSQAYLTGLLSIYRHYYPSLIHVVVPRTYKTFFPTYDRKWCAQVRKVREQNGLSPQPDMSWEQALVERLHPSGQNIDLMPSTRKRRKIDPIPVITSLATKTSYKTDSLKHTLGISSVPFVQVQLFKHLLDYIDSVEFPSQIGAVLRSDTLKHLMSYTKDPIAAARFQFWISETLQEELIDVHKDKDQHKTRVKSLLTLLKAFTDFIQEGVPAVDIVLSEYLQNWNGMDYGPLILKLITRCRMYSFSFLNKAVLEPLRKLFFTSSVYSKCKILMCLTELLRNYAANEWPRNQEVSSTDSPLCLFNKESDDIDSVEVIMKYVKVVSRMILVAMVAEKHHALMELCILDFLETVCNLHKEYHLPFVVLVEPQLFERLVTSPNPVTVSRLCAVIAMYKENFNSLKTLQRQGEIEVLNKDEFIRSCNLLTVQLCNTLWRSKAYSTNDKKSIFMFDPVCIDKQLTDTDIRDSLSLYRHPAFLGYTLQFLAQMPKEFSILDLKIMRREYLQHLDAHGMTGVSKFISTFIRNRTSMGGTTQLLGMSQTLNPAHLTVNNTHVTTGNDSAFGF